MSADLRAEFEAWARGKSLEMIRDRDAWGREKYKHSHIDAMWEAYQAAAHATARKCITIAREVDEQDERDNGAASTGAAATVWTRLTDEFPDAFGEG